MPIEEFEDNRKNEVDEERSGQLDSFISQVAVDNNYEPISTQKCRYDRKFATYSDFGEITGEKIKIVENNIAVIDIDINYEDIDKYFDMKYADSIIQDIEDKVIEVASNNNAIVVKTASDSYHIYCNGELIRNDALLANKKSSYIKAFEYIETFDCDDGSKIDIKLFDVDIFIPTEFGSSCGVMLPGSRVINKKGNYSCYTIIKDKDNVDEKISSIYYIWDDINELFDIGNLDSIWVEEKEPRSPYKTKKLNDSEIVKNGMSKKMFDLIIEGFNGVEIHNWAAPIEKEITLYPLICGLNACINGEIDELDVEIAIESIKKNAKLTLNAELNFDRIMFSTDDVSSTPFSLLKMLRIHNPEYYKNNLSPLVAKTFSMSNNICGDNMIITLDMLRLVINGFNNLYIYADFEFTSDEITIVQLLKSLYSFESEYISINDIKLFESYIIKYCNLSNSARRQLRDVDCIKGDDNKSYLFEMLKIHNPLHYSNEIEPIFYLKNTGINLNDNFTVYRINNKNYFNNGNIVWDDLFSDISRSLVMIESDDCAYIKVADARRNSHKLTRCSMEQLKNRLNKITIKSIDKNGKNFRLGKLLFDDKFINITPYYESIYWKRGVCFYSKRDDYLSLFTGFTFRETNDINMEKISLFMNHIKNIIADGNEELYNYILSWISFIVQNPGKKTETCLMILGEEGTGKTMFTTVICKLFGNYALSNIASIDDVVGRFNSITENKMLVVLNEVTAMRNTTSKKGIYNRLRMLITEDVNVINKKGIDKYEVENVSNYIICSTEFNPLTISENDRRYVVTEVSNSKKYNTIYFSKLFNSFDEEFYINLYNYFRLFNIKGFDLKNIPMTEKRQSMMNANADSFIYYMKENFYKYAKPTLTRSESYNDYMIFSKSSGCRFIHLRKRFAELINKICIIKQVKIPGTDDYKRYYVLTKESLEKYKKLELK